MAKENQFMSTRDFASQAGMTTQKVSKLIREGKIKAEKKSGKWMILPNQLKGKLSASASKDNKLAAKTPPSKSATTKKPGMQKKTKPSGKKAAGGKSYSLAEFVAMTYLTEYGVKEWLKQGRLTGQQNDTGEWQIDASNLDRPSIQRMVRNV
jgi:hypothetical protein